MLQEVRLAFGVFYPKWMASRGVYRLRRYMVGRGLRRLALRNHRHSLLSLRRKPILGENAKVHPSLAQDQDRVPKNQNKIWEF